MIVGCLLFIISNFKKSNYKSNISCLIAEENMEIITSHDNALVKKLLKLSDKKYRKTFNQYIVEGYRSVVDTLKYNTTHDIVDCLVVAQSQFDKFGSMFKSISVLSDKLFDDITDTISAQGILAVVNIPKHTSMLPLSNNCLFLDRIRDPGNLGTIIRTACATGFSDIYCYDCVDIYNSKVVRSSMTGILNTRLFDVEIDFLQELIKNNYSLIGGDIMGNSIFDTEILGNKNCLIIGNEANGIDEKILSKCNYKLSLPMEKIESLNAAVSASVFMYTIKYKNKETDYVRS